MDLNWNKVVSDIFDIITELIPSKNETVLNAVNDKLNELNSLLDGIYLINELSPKTSDKLVSFGELLSSYIISETMKSRGLNTERKNSQELVVTDSNFTKAEVDYALTNKNIRDYFNKANQQITILPGFISKCIRHKFSRDIQSMIGRKLKLVSKAIAWNC